MLDIHYMRASRVLLSHTAVPKLLATNPAKSSDPIIYIQIFELRTPEL